MDGLGNEKCWVGVPTVARPGGQSITTWRKRKESRQCQGIRGGKHALVRACGVLWVACGATIMSYVRHSMRIRQVLSLLRVRSRSPHEHQFPAHPLGRILRLLQHPNWCRAYVARAEILGKVPEHSLEARTAIAQWVIVLVTPCRGLASCVQVRSPAVIGRFCECLDLLENCRPVQFDHPPSNVRVHALKAEPCQMALRQLAKAPCQIGQFWECQRLCARHAHAHAAVLECWTVSARRRCFGWFPWTVGRHDGGWYGSSAI